MCLISKKCLLKNYLNLRFTNSELEKITLNTNLTLTKHFRNTNTQRYLYKQEVRSKIFKALKAGQSKAKLIRDIGSGKILVYKVTGRKTI